MVEYLAVPYGDEAVDDGTRISPSYGGEFLPYLLWALSRLKEPEVWADGDDVDTVLREVDDLLVRLMVGEVELTQTLASLPLEIPIAGLVATAPETLTLQQAAIGSLNSIEVISSATDQDAEWFNFDVYLPVGDFDLRVWARVGVSKPKISFTISSGATINTSVADLWAATADEEYNLPFAIEVTTAGVKTITVWKWKKRAASTGSRAVISRLIIEES